MTFIRQLYRFGAGALGAGACCTIGYYAVSYRFTPQAPQPTSRIVGPSASSLTAAIVDSVLKDSIVVDRAVTLVAKAFLHPTATASLKEHFIGEFTDNEDTLRSLKTFVVEDVIKDPWVSEELITLSKQLGKQLVAEPTIWPGQSLTLLKEAALEGLEEERFKTAALSVAKSVVA